MDDPSCLSAGEAERVFEKGWVSLNRSMSYHYCGNGCNGKPCNPKDWCVDCFRWWNLGNEMIYGGGHDKAGCGLDRIEINS